MNANEYALGDTVYIFHTRSEPSREGRVEKITATQVTVKVLENGRLMRFMLSNGNEFGTGNSWSYWYIMRKEDGARRWAEVRVRDARRAWEQGMIRELEKAATTLRNRTAGHIEEEERSQFLANLSRTIGEYADKSLKIWGLETAERGAEADSMLAALIQE